MHLNDFADGLEPLDLTRTEEFRSLLQSAADLGIPHDPGVRYLSRNTVLRHHRFHFLEWGNPAAPPVLLLHGGNQSAHSWDLVSLHLSGRFHVVALDQRGHGDSEWARDADYSQPAMAADALAFVEQQGLRRPLVMGHSMGGGVTMAASVERPDWARALVFVDISPEPATRGVDQVRTFIERNVEFDTLEEFINEVAGYDPFRTRAHMERTARYNVVRRADGKFISKSDRILHDPVFMQQRRDQISRVTLADMGRLPQPALVVRGEQSTVLEPEAAERFAAALPRGRRVTVSRCGHNVHTQNTPEFLEKVRPFLEATASG